MPQSGVLAIVALGDTATWLIFVATAMAAVLAAFAFRSEQRQRQALSEDAVQAKARAVAAWVEIEERTPPQWHSAFGSADVTVAVARAKNASNLPVYHCLLVFYRGDDPNGEPIGQVKAPAVLPPGETQTVDAPAEVLECDSDADPVVSIEFTDSSLRRWRREWCHQEDDAREGFGRVEEDIHA